MREEVNKLSGADTELVCQLAEKLLTTVCKDVRVATYYLWARLHHDGESGLAEGLELLSGLVSRYGDQLLPSRKNSRRAAMEWLAGSKVLDSLSLYPEVDKPKFERILAALTLFEDVITSWEDASRPTKARCRHLPASFVLSVLALSFQPAQFLRSARGSALSCAKTGHSENASARPDR